MQACTIPLFVSIFVMLISQSAAGLRRSQFNNIDVKTPPESDLIEPLVGSPQSTSETDTKKHIWIKLLTNNQIFTDEEQNKLYLKCDALGGPAPEIAWYQGNDIKEEIMRLQEERIFYATPQGVELAIVNSTYKIDCANLNDSAPIFCIGLGLKDVEYKQIDMVNRDYVKRENCQPHPSSKVSKGIASIFKVMGSRLVLPCSSNSEGIIFWKGPTGIFQQYVATNNNYRVVADGSLAITNLQWKDMGEWICIDKSTNRTIVTTFVYPLAANNE